MDTQNWQINGIIIGKLVLLISVTPIPYTAIAKSDQLTTIATNSAIASEINPTLLSMPENMDIVDTVPEQNLKVLQVNKTKPTLPSSQEENEPIILEEDQLDFSDTGRAGQQSAGEARGQCASSKFPLTALVPTSNWGKTVKKHPTFWFYVPAYSDSVTEMEFVLQDQDRNHLWKKQLPTNKNLSYFNVSLPQDQSELKIGQWYRWYLKIYCDQEKRYPPKVVYGWITRVATDSVLQSQLKSKQKQPYSVYGQAGIWFDAIDSLLQTPNLKKTSLNFRKAWFQLTKAKGVDLNLPLPQCSTVAVN